MKLLYFVVGLLLIAATACAVSITPSNTILSVKQGDVASFDMYVSGTNFEKIDLTAFSNDLTLTLSQKNFTLNGTQQATLFALTNDVAPGFYEITVTATTATSVVSKTLALKVLEGDGVLRLTSKYARIYVMQGEPLEMEFTLRSTSDEVLRNIIVRSDIPSTLHPEYPDVIDLLPRESTSVKVKLGVPVGYPTGVYTFTFNAAYGNLESIEDVIVVVKERADVTNMLDVELLKPWEPLREGGDVVGYQLFLRVRNEGSADISGIDVFFTGLPVDWQIEGDTKFSIRPFELKDLTVNIKTTDFNDHTANLLVVKDYDIITNQTIDFSGYKVGVTATGSFMMGGSIVIGLLFIAVIVLVLLYVRQKNVHAEVIENTKTKTYLQDLVERAKRELGDSKSAGEDGEDEEDEEKPFKLGKKAKR